MFWKRITRKRAAALIAGTLCVCTLGGVVLYFTTPYLASFETLFRWSLPDFEIFAAEVMAPGSTALQHPPDKLGYFEVVGAERLPHGFVVQTTMCNWFDWCGIAYSDVPLVDEWDETNQKLLQKSVPLLGRWYRVWRPEPERYHERSSSLVH